MIAISQSGETADTLAAVAQAKERGATALGIVNVVGSTIARETDAGVYLHAGPEIGVASTKAFTAQVAVLTMLAIELGRRRHISSDDAARYYRASWPRSPTRSSTILEQSDHIREIAAANIDRENWLFLGRGFNYPVALEGALKLKEISYIHAEGLPAAEMKHGPIALINDGMPAVFIATAGPQYDKVISNIEEVRARGGKIIAVATEGRRRHRQERRPRHLRPRRAGAAPADADGRSAAAAGLPRRRAPRLQRGQAAQPGQERDGRVILPGHGRHSRQISA